MNAQPEPFVPDGAYLMLSMIEACTDEAQLAAWYINTEELICRIRDDVEAFRFVGTADPDWLRRSGGKLSRLRTALRWVERHMVMLGMYVPYPPTDPRKRQLRELEEVVRKLRNALKQQGVAVLDVREGEGADG